MESRYAIPQQWTNGNPPEDWVKDRTYSDKKPLPAFAPGADSGVDNRDRVQILLAVYAEVCDGWRCLTDVRFKLLGLVPVVSLTAITAILSRAEGGNAALQSGEVTALTLFGFLATVGVRLYDLRNTELYNDLVGRGRQIEGELGIHTGHFRGRPKSHGWIEHDRAIALIYGVSMIGWILAGISPWIRGL
jgi:hypothetical protein